MLSLNIQKFAGEGNQDPSGNQDPNPSGEGEQSVETIKFGNVAIPVDGLSEEQKNLLANAQNAYVAKEQTVSKLGQEKNQYKSELDKFRNTQNQNPNPNNGGQFGGNELPSNQNQYQFNNQGVDPNRFASIEMKIADMEINSYKSVEYQKMASSHGKDFTEKVFKMADKEFNTKHTDPASRTPQTYDAYVKYFTGIEASKPREGVVDLSNDEQFYAMMNNPLYKEKFQAYLNAQNNANVPHMVGNQGGVNAPKSQEEIQREMSGLSKEERKAKMMEAVNKDMEYARMNAFLGKNG